MTRRLTPQTTLDNLKKEAKRWLKALRANHQQERTRFEQAYPNAPAAPGLRDVQHAIAREFGFAGWTELKNEIARLHPETSVVAKYDQLAQDMVAVYASGNAEAMQRINAHYRQSATADDLRATVWRLLERVRRAKGATEAFGLSEAQEVIARTSGFGNWAALTDAVAKGAPPPGQPYALNGKQSKITLRRIPTDAEWDAIIAVMKELRISALEASGFMTDNIMKRISSLDHVISLNLESSRLLTDDGLLHLASMPQLQQLNLSEYPGGRITDRGLEVLRHLLELRTFHMSWQSGITDAGVGNLAFCDQLESVDLMGTPTGDGAIRALRGKPKLHRFKTGRLVTDAGLPLLHDFPMFKAWLAEREIKYGLMVGDAPNQLLIDGPFTDKGLASLAGLDGLCGLTLFWHISGVTAEGFRSLAELPNLGSLRCDDELCNDEAMRHIAALPKLRFLACQDTVASDEGFAALSRSRSIEYVWGRRCYGLSGRGFTALAKMPALRGLGVSCKNVDDESLAALADISELRELVPIGVRDEGFRHVGQCQALEHLWCMYCRDTTDVATEHIAGLRLKTYYAGATQITDRSLEILGRMKSLERIELHETKGVTDAGLGYLASLPRLREIELTALPNITAAGVAVFPAHIRVKHAL